MHVYHTTMQSGRVLQQAPTRSLGMLMRMSHMSTKHVALTIPEGGREAAASMTWVRAKFYVAHLRSLDWQSRHQYWDRYTQGVQPAGRNRLMEKVKALMGPDELMCGQCTGVPRGLQAIVLKDKTRKKALKQVTLHRYFYVKRERVPSPRQVTLHRYVNEVS